MVTWFNMLPILISPVVIYVLLGTLPDMQFDDVLIGGTFVREWCVDQFFLRFLADDYAQSFVDWYRHSSLGNHLAVHGLIGLNLYVLFFPIIYLYATSMIRFSKWKAKSKLTQLNR